MAYQAPLIRGPVSADYYNQFVWRDIPEQQRQAMATLRDETHGVFHDSSYHYATTHGKEQRLRQLADQLLTLNNCIEQPDTYNEDGSVQKYKLTDQQVGEAFEVLMLDQKDPEDPTAGNISR